MIPMTLGSFILFAIVVYLAIIVGKTVWDNYQSNTQIETEQQKLVELQDELTEMENEIVYYNTFSFKEKQARAKLGYIAPGEKALSLPTDEPAPGDSQQQSEASIHVDVPNYYLWIDYFLD